MNALLLNRSLGSGPSNALSRYIHRNLLESLHPAKTRFSSAPASESQEHDHITINPERGAQPPVSAHYGGVNALDIDSFDGRYLISGGADGTISIWDLESRTISDEISPRASTTRTSRAHTYGITSISFYPFDAAAFLSTSFDTNLKIYSSETLAPSASFPLDAPVYSHSVSLIASHLLVACATQLPAIRLVDLRSGAAAHALAGHVGAVLDVAWSPTEEHVLASAGTDGTLRLWDVRRSAGQLGALDMEDSIGVLGYDGHGTGARHNGRGKAHAAAVNGLVWTQDGRHLVSTGHDDRIRVWDIVRGANTLANFGRYVKNHTLARVRPCLVPINFTEPGRDVLLFPSEREILMAEVFDGRLLRRLWIEGVGPGNLASPLNSRSKDLAWRPHDVEFYSAHTDGCIRAWKLRDTSNEESEDDPAEEERKRKRQVLDDIYADVTKKRFTMTT
jgi:DNA excision repair protein ERCC-8